MPGSLHGVRKPKGVAVRPGSVRQARLEKGLSLADVAGSEVTRASIHLVEMGKMRPSMRTLQLIAQRTGRPVSYFLDGQEGTDEHRAARDHLSHLVDTGDYAAAIAVGNRLLDVRLDPGIEADVRYTLGQAHVRRFEGDAALRQLTRARELYERMGDSLMGAHALDQEAVALFVLGDPRALTRALEALERTDRLVPPSPALRASILNLLGAIHVRKHDWRTAARFYEMGLEASDSLVSIREVARLHDGLTAARLEMGDFGGALRSADRALAFYSMDADASALIRAENNLGYALLRHGELDAAAAHLDRALQLCDEHAVPPVVRAVVLTSVGELALTRGHMDVAQDRFLQALEIAASANQRQSEATVRHLLGRVHAQLGDMDEARRSFAGAIELLQQLQLTDRLRECAIEYAELLNRQGRLEESIAYWRIAASAAGRAGEFEAAASMTSSGA
jgi:tetratricopeptide (TPR) repeat protein/DNA-binding XRE family transcriptional regulator